MMMMVTIIIIIIVWFKVEVPVQKDRGSGEVEMKIFKQTSLNMDLAVVLQICWSQMPGD